MKRKVIAGLMLSTMIFCLTACGSGNDKKDNISDNTQETSEVETDIEMTPTEETTEGSESESDIDVTSEEESTENAIETALNMTDEELLAYNENNWEDICVTKIDGGVMYEGEFSVVGINKNGIEKIAPNVIAEAEYSYQMFVFPTSITGLSERQADQDGQTLMDSYDDSIVTAVGKKSDSKIYYGDEDATYTYLSEMDGIRLYVLPSPIEKIYNSAFAGATDIERVVLNDTMTYIDHRAFADCTNLKRINLPSSITEIEASAFENCPNLVAVVDEGSYAEAYCKNNGISIEYTGNVIDTGYGISEYEFEQLEPWKRTLMESIKKGCEEDKENYLFKLLFVFQERSLQTYYPVLACWNKNSGDFDKNVEIYKYDKVKFNACPDCISRQIYVYESEGEYELLEVTEQYNNEELPTEIWYDLISNTAGDTYGSTYYDEAGTLCGTRNYYDYIMENFDINTATKLSQEDFVSYEEIFKKILEE